MIEDGISQGGGLQLLITLPTAVAGPAAYNAVCLLNTFGVLDFD
jgi:hypothetical protein